MRVIVMEFLESGMDLDFLILRSSCSHNRRLVLPIGYWKLAEYVFGARFGAICDWCDAADDMDELLIFDQSEVCEEAE